jgi:hypothetical protein
VSARAGSRALDPCLAAAAALIALGFYLATLPPSFAFWDTGELQTVASILGIAHPPACPAFVLLGWLFAHGLPFGNDAWRVDAMCSLAVASAAGLLYLTARELGASRAAAAVCALGFAFADVTWKDATRAEVQDVALVFRALAFFFALRYARDGAARDFFALALATGLAGATHGISILLVPGLVIVVLTRGFPGPRLLALGFAGIALGLLPYAYLPLRSGWVYAHRLDPTLSLGLPVGLPFWDYDHPSTWTNFGRVLTGADFDVHSGFAGFGDVAAYGRFGAALVRRTYGAYGYVGCLVAALGAGAFAVRRDPFGIALVVVALLPVPYTESYNELQDPDRYYLFTLWCAAAAMATGFDLLLELFQPSARSPLRFTFLAGLIASFVAAAPDRSSTFAQRNDDAAPRYVADVKTLTPSNAIVLAEWAYSTPLAYAAYVDGTFGNRVVVAAGPTQYLSYVRGWLRTRPVYVVSFDDSLALEGLRVSLVRDGPYYVYQVKRPRP